MSLYTAAERLNDELHDLEQILICAHRRLDQRGIPRPNRTITGGNDGTETESGT